MNNNNNKKPSPKKVPRVRKEEPLFVRRRSSRVPPQRLPKFDVAGRFHPRLRRRAALFESSATPTVRLKVSELGVFSLGEGFGGL